MENQLKGEYRFINIQYGPLKFMSEELNEAVKELEKGTDNGDWQFTRRVEVVSHNTDFHTGNLSVIVKIGSKEE